MVSKFILFEKFSFEGPIPDVMLHSGNYSDCENSLPTDHFVNQTFGGSNWSLTEQLVKGCQPLINEQLDNEGQVFKRQWTFFHFLIWKFIPFEKILWERFLSCYIWYSGNSLDCRLVMQNNRFVNRTFPGSNWSTTEQLVKTWFIYSGRNNIEGTSWEWKYKFQVFNNIRQNAM